MRHLKTLLLALLLFPTLAFASGWNDQEYKQIEQSILKPQLHERQFVISSLVPRPMRLQPKTRRLSTDSSLWYPEKVAVR